MSNLLIKLARSAAETANELKLGTLNYALTECADALEAKDAEIARLTADLTRLGKTSEDAAEVAPLHLGTTAEDWAGMWNVANERANAAETEIARLRTESDELTKARRDALTWAADIGDRLDILRRDVMTVAGQLELTDPQLGDRLRGAVERATVGKPAKPKAVFEVWLDKKMAERMERQHRIAETDRARKGGD